jgi:hypothetical protein
MIVRTPEAHSVRMLVPPVVHRREMDRKLVEFFHEDRPTIFRRAIADFCRFYVVKPPRIEWCEYIDWGRAAGKTFEDGRIHLVHPENWRRGRIYRSERLWVQTVYHELAHYLFWTDAERKAEAFTCRMVRGLRRKPRRIVVAKRGSSAVNRATSRRASGTRRAVIARRRARPGVAANKVRRRARTRRAG